MKKVIKNRIFLVIVTLIIGTSLGVYAANTYKATDVIYNGSDGTSKDVNEALNELYELKSNNSVKYELLQNWRRIYVANSSSSNETYVGPDNYYEYTAIIIFFHNNQQDRQIYAGIATNCTSSVNQYGVVQGAVITLTNFTGVPKYQFQMYGSNSPYIIVYGIK